MSDHQVESVSRSVMERYLDLPGVRLFVREVGSGMPVVVLHGGPDFNHNYLRHLPGASGLGFELDPVVFRLTTCNLAALELPIRILHMDFRAGFGAAQIGPGSPLVLFVAPPWGKTLDAKTGLDLGRTDPPIVEVLDAAIAAFPANPMVVAIQVHESLDPQSAAQVGSRLEGLTLTIYPLTAPGRNHGILLGTRNLSRSN